MYYVNSHAKEMLNNKDNKKTKLEAENARLSNKKEGKKGI